LWWWCVVVDVAADPSGGVSPAVELGDVEPVLEPIEPELPAPAPIEPPPV
jgi:hypothetical protein